MNIIRVDGYGTIMSGADVEEVVRIKCGDELANYIRDTLAYLSEKANAAYWQNHSDLESYEEQVNDYHRMLLDVVDTIDSLLQNYAKTEGRNKRAALSPWAETLRAMRNDINNIL